MDVATQGCCRMKIVGNGGHERRISTLETCGLLFVEVEIHYQLHEYSSMDLVTFDLVKVGESTSYEVGYIFEEVGRVCVEVFL